MRKSKFSEEMIIGILKAHRAVASAPDLRSKPCQQRNGVHGGGHSAAPGKAKTLD